MNERNTPRAGDSRGVKDSAGRLNSHFDFTAYIAGDPLYEQHLRSWLEGYHARDAEVAQLNHTADRLYTEVCRRTPPKTPDLIPHARLEQIRNEIYYRGVA